MNKNSLIYVRISVEDKNKPNISPDVQVNKGKELIKKEGLTLAETPYIDRGKTGTNMNRPGLQALLARCKKGDIYAVVVQDTSRLSRNTSDYLTIKTILKDYGTKLISVNQPMAKKEDPYAEFIDEITASVNALQPRVTSMKVKLTMNAKFEYGIWPSWAPVGYKNIDNKTFTCDLDKKIVIPHPKQSKLVTEAFSKYCTNNYSISHLCEEMYKEGLVSRSGKMLSTSSMQQLLTNTFYYGLMRRNGEKKIGKHKALITKRLFDRCQYVLAKKRHFLVRKRKYQFLLNGFLFCAEHQTRLGGDMQKNINSKIRSKIAYYHCFHQGGCKGSYIETETLEKSIERRIKKYQFSDKFIKLIGEKLKERLEHQRRDFQSQRQVLVNQKIALENQRSKTENHLLNETITEEAYRRMSNNIEHQLNIVKSEITDFESQQNLDFDLVKQVLGLTRNIYQSYQEAPDFIKKRYLRLLFESIYIKDRKVVKVTENPMFSTLRKQHLVLIRTNWLRWLVPVRTFFIKQIITPKFEGEIDISLLPNEEIEPKGVFASTYV